MLRNFLSMIGMSDKEIDIYLCTARYGQASVATICEQLDRERTSTYKLMSSMIQRGRLVAHHSSKNTYYQVTDIHTLRRQRDQQLQVRLHLDHHYDLIGREFEQLASNPITSTTVKLYDGLGALTKMYNDIAALIHEHHYIHIKYFGSRTFESLANRNVQVADVHQKFLTHMDDLGVHVQGYLGTGMSLMEQLVSTAITPDTDLSSSNHAVCLWNVGHHVYIIIFKKAPQIIHIHSYEYAQLMHFVGEQLEKQSDQ